jgi:dTDP-glucose 4,6-dehydratase
VNLRSKAMRVAVTGAGGFIGSHVVEALLSAGHDVRALVRYSSSGRRGWLETLESNQQNAIDFVAGDIRDSAQMRGFVSGCDLALHLAALIAIPYSYQAPESYVDTNVRGTLNILEAAKINQTRVAVVSTSEVYGTAQQVPITEAHALNAQSPYAATKIAADQLALSFHRAFELPVTVVRPFNTFGPRQSTRAVIPTIITQLIAGAKELKLGALSPTRDLTYVTDTADGIIAVGSHPASIGQTIQLGTGREISIGDLARLLIALTGSTATIAEDPQRLRPTASEVERLLSDPRQAFTQCGWQARLSLEEGLKKTIEWFKCNLQHYRPDDYGL